MYKYFTNQCMNIADVEKELNIKASEGWKLHTLICKTGMSMAVYTMIFEKKENVHA